MSAADQPLYSHQESVHIDAPPARVWELVTSMERYGEWSSENCGGYWRKKDGVPGTGRVGDQFVGINRRGDTEWKALVEIVERDEERAFAFVTGGSELNYVHWRYQLEADGDGTLLTEQWALRNLSPIMIENGDAEVQRRVANAHESIAATLAGMKRAAEAAGD
ncbi:MAG: SRPBCC family protein [Acidimicrobiia bacterium]